MSGENLPNTHEHSGCKSAWSRDGKQILKTLKSNTLLIILTDQ